MTAKKAPTVKKATTSKSATSKKKTSKASSKAKASAKHKASATAKHTAHLKHLAHLHHLHVEHVAHEAAIGKPVGVAVGDWLPVCAFEALAASLRLAGQRVHADDVGELWTLAGTREVTIAEALDAAARFGLAGCRNVTAIDAVELARRIADEDLNPFDGERPDLEAAVADGAGTIGVVKLPVFPWPVVAERVAAGHALILGIDRPGPHAVLATPDGWWSWGELHSPWPARITEAWAVSWS